MKPDFIIIPQILIDDKNLSPADWVVYGIVYWFERMKDGRCTASNNRIAEVGNLKSRTVRASLEKLEAGKYITREFKDEERKTRIQIITLVAFSKVGTPMPTQGRLKTARRVGSNEPHISNKEESNNNTSAPKTGAKDVAELIDGFQMVDPNWRRLFGRKNQRSAVERMLAQHGRPALEKIIAFLPRNNADPYAPKITSPIQLEEGMGRMKAHWDQKKNKNGVREMVDARHK